MARIMRQPRRVALLGAALLGALAALATILFVAWTAVSANAGAVTATISDDTDASATRCDNEIRSDSTCDLILRVFNTTSHPRTWTLDKILVDHAFDASTVTPQTGTPGATKTLGQCPCQYPIAANTNQTYKIHIEVGDLRDGYTSGKIKVYATAYNGGQFPPSAIETYQLDIEIATSITINTVTDTTIDLSWVGNVFATRAFIFWWPEGSTFDSVTPMTTKDSTYTITGLTPATKYLVRVQPYKALTKYQAKQVEVTTKASATPTPTPVVGITASSGATEGSPVTFTVSATPAPTTDLVVSLTITTTGDYGVTAGDRTVTIMGGTSSATLSLPTNNDSTDEPNGLVTATLVDGTEYDLGANKTATVTVADNDLPFTSRGNTCGPMTKQQGPITIGSTPGETWCPVHVSYSNGRYPYSPPSFDHVMGFVGTLTYNVSVPADSCPATVQIRGAPVTGWGEIPRSNLAGIVAGSVVPATRVGSDPLSLNLQFTGSGAACSTPQQVTIYGVKAYLDHLESRGNVKIRHTLTQRNGNLVTEAGPRLSIWMLNDAWIDLNVGIPFVAAADRTMSSEVHSDFGYSGTAWPTWKEEVGTETVSYINNVGPASTIGNMVDTRPFRRFFAYSYVRAPLPSATERWTEFCVYIHPREIPDINAAGEMLLSNKGLYRTPYRQLTLVPYTHDVDVWWYPNTHDHTPDDGYRLPFELQRYTSVVNPGGRCEPASGGGTWQTVYSGGPTADTAEAHTTWQATTSNNVVPFVIVPQHLGQYINVRIRGVYGVSTSSSTQGMRLTPSSVLYVKFNLLEVPSVRAQVPIVLSFVDTSSD